MYDNVRQLVKSAHIGVLKGVPGALDHVICRFKLARCSELRREPFLLEEGRIFLIILAKDLFKSVLLQISLIKMVKHARDRIEFDDRLVIRWIQVMDR